MPTTYHTLIDTHSISYGDSAEDSSNPVLVDQVRGCLFQYLGISLFQRTRRKCVDGPDCPGGIAEHCHLEWSVEVSEDSPLWEGLGGMRLVLEEGE